MYLTLTPSPICLAIYCTANCIFNALIKLLFLTVHAAGLKTSAIRATAHVYDLEKKLRKTDHGKKLVIDKESDRTKGGKRNLKQRELVNIEIRNVEYADAGLTVEKILTVLQHVILFRCSGSVLSANS